MLSDYRVIYNEFGSKREMNKVENKEFNNPDEQQSENLAIFSHIAYKINASLDIQETLDAIVEAAAELISCSLVELDLWDANQQKLVLQAIRSTPERAFPIGKSFPLGTGYTSWMVRNRQPLLVPDVDARSDIQPDILPGELPFKSYLGHPLVVAEKLIGVLVLVHDIQDAFNEDDLLLLEALAGQATIAIQNARLFEDTQRKARKLAALNEVASVINQPLSLGEIMARAIEKVIVVTESAAGGIRLLDPDSDELVIVASHGLNPDYIQQVDRIRLGEGVVGRVAQSGKALVIKNLAQDRRAYDRQAAAQHELTAFAAVPLMIKERTIGTLGVASKDEIDFTEEDLDLLRAIGDQIGLVIENDELRQERLKEERLTAIGKVATGVAHDLRSPLGSILRSAEFLSRSELSPGTREKLSSSIISLTRRLIGSTQQILDYVQGHKPTLHLQPCSLIDLLDEALEVFHGDLSDQGIEIIRQYNFKGSILMDANRMAQVAYNLISNARDAMPRGGSLFLSTERVNDSVVIRFSDTGPGVPPELSERIFEPYFSFGKNQGAGLGLAISRQIVQEHGGKIRVASEEGTGATFIISLPAHTWPHR
jgi:signal transduction histidine kinase